MDEGLHQRAPPDSMSAIWVFRNTRQEQYDARVELCYFRNNEMPLKRFLQIPVAPGVECDMEFTIQTDKPEDTGVYTHTDVFCDVCHKEIAGCRYKCGNCRNYDLCEECETLEGVHDPYHIFLKIPRPLPRKRRATGEYRCQLLPCQLYCTGDDGQSREITDADSTGKSSLWVKRWVISNTGSEPFKGKILFKTSISDLSDAPTTTLTIAVGELQPATEGEFMVTLHVPLQHGQGLFRHRARCDHCNCHPIVGIRYRCGNCEDYDLCEECEPLDIHNPDHVFMKMRRGLSHSPYLYGPYLKKVLYGKETVPSASVKEAAAQSPPTADNAMCVICWTSTRDTAFLPCGHRHFCHPCAQRLYETARDDGCPTCRSVIDGVTKIYE